MTRLPIECPSCGQRLEVRRLTCPGCGTAVEGSYPLPPLAALSPADQDFITQFVKASGSLKDMAGHLGVSYPTVRNRLDDIIARLCRLEDERGDGDE